jgi:hypothetical protein
MDLDGYIIAPQHVCYTRIGLSGLEIALDGDPKTVILPMTLPKVRDFLALLSQQRFIAADRLLINPRKVSMISGLGESVLLYFIGRAKPVVVARRQIGEVVAYLDWSESVVENPDNPQPVPTQVAINANPVTGEIAFVFQSPAPEDPTPESAPPKEDEPKKARARKKA